MADASFPPVSVNTPERTTAAAFPRYLRGHMLADSAALQWPELYARRVRCQRVMNRHRRGWRHRQLVSVPT